MRNRNFLEEIVPQEEKELFGIVEIGEVAPAAPAAPGQTGNTVPVPTLNIKSAPVGNAGANLSVVTNPQAQTITITIPAKSAFTPVSDQKVFADFFKGAADAIIKNLPKPVTPNTTPAPTGGANPAAAPTT